jgi:hypothetical protein
LLRTCNFISFHRYSNFAQKVQGNSATSLNNILIDIARLGNYSIRFIINGLLDRDAQPITFNTMNISVHASQFEMIKKNNTQ